MSFENRRADKLRTRNRKAERSAKVRAVVFADLAASL